MRALGRGIVLNIKSNLVTHGESPAVNALRPKPHAVQRMSQRALKVDDLDLIMLLGVEVPDGLFVRRKECEVAARKLVDLAEQIQGLPGTRVVLDGGRVITGYRALPRQQRRLPVTEKRARFEDEREHHSHPDRD